jgi:hypothetical protein
MQLASGAVISLDGSGNVTTSGFTNASVAQDAGFVVVTFDSMTADDIVVGYSSTYYDGKLDEFMLWTTVPTSQTQTDIESNAFYSNHSQYNDLALWWAFDNPVRGNNRTNKVTQETF